MPEPLLQPAEGRVMGSDRDRVRAWEPSTSMIRTRRAVAQAFDVDERTLMSKHRFRHIVHARHAACWVLRERYGLSYPLLGKVLGGRDHSTVIHGYRQAEELRAGDALFRARTDALLLGEALAMAPVKVPQAELDEVARRAFAESEAAVRQAALQSYRPRMAGPITWNADDPDPIDAKGDEAVGEAYFGGVTIGSARLLKALRREFPQRCGVTA